MANNDTALYGADQIEAKKIKYKQMKEIIKTYYDIPDVNIEDIDDIKTKIEYNKTVKKFIELFRSNYYLTIDKTFNNEIMQYT